MMSKMKFLEKGSRVHWGECLVVAIVCVTATAVAAAYLGQDINWDQRNYHLYVVYAWLTGRLWTDLAPAQIQTWFNPLPYLHNYLLIRYTRPVVAGAVTGAIAGIDGLLLWILARQVFDGSREGVNRWCAGLVTVFGLTGSIFVSYLGRTFGECSPLVLAGLICATSAKGDMSESSRRFLAAGCCVGAACGLKLTNFVYALGMAATLLVLWPFVRLRVSSLLMYAVGGAVGFIATGGYWATKLWLAFGNPVFPFFNRFFQSPMYEPINVVDPDYLPASFVRAAVTYPFEWLLGIYKPSSPQVFRDPRFALVAGLLPLAIIVALLRSGKPRPSDGEVVNPARELNFWILSLFFVFSYLIWLNQFGVQRYVLTLELLTGVVLLLSLERLLQSATEVSVVLGLLVIGSLLWTRAPDWSRMPYGADWWGVPAVEETASPTLYVMTGGKPMAYLIPYMPQADRFVRLGGNMPLEPNMPLGQRALSLMQAHTGPIRSLCVVAGDQEVERLQRFGLRLQPDSCKTLQSLDYTFWTCALDRMPPPLDAH